LVVRVSPAGSEAVKTNCPELVGERTAGFCVSCTTGVLTGTHIAIAVKLLDETEAVDVQVVPV
jgi:hypothetical protein